MTYLIYTINTTNNTHTYIKQCELVTTHCLSMRAPLQKMSSLSISITTHGVSPAPANLPSETEPIVMSLSTSFFDDNFCSPHVLSSASDDT